MTLDLSLAIAVEEERRRREASMRPYEAPDRDRLLSLGEHLDLEEWCQAVEVEERRRWEVEEKIRSDPGEAARDREECRGDLVAWVRRWGRLPLPKARPGDRELSVPWILFPAQEQLFRSALRWIDEGGAGAVAKSREVGVTWLWLTLVLGAWLFWPGFRARLFSRTERAVDDFTADSLFGMIRWQLARQPDHLRILPSPDRVPAPGQYCDSHLRLLCGHVGGSTSEIVGEATTDDVGRGCRGALVLFDEMATVQPRTQRAAWVSLQTVPRLAVAVSTPGGPGTQFHRLVRGGLLPRDRVVELDWRADPRRTEAWRAAQEQSGGGSLTAAEAAREFDVSFRGVDSHVIWTFDRGLVEYSDEELPDRARDLLPCVGGMDFGSGPSQTVYVVVLVDWSDSVEADVLGRRVRIPTWWVDAAMSWSRTPAAEIARDIHELQRAYRGRWMTWADPAGEAVDSEQRSWISNLQAARVPIRPLEEGRTHAVIGQAVDLVQGWLQGGRIRVHEDRCPADLDGMPHLCDAMGAWSWDIPEGVDPGTISRAVVKWRKDGPSHYCEALWYSLVGSVLYSQPVGVRRPSPGPRPRLRSRGLEERRISG